MSKDAVKLNTRTICRILAKHGNCWVDEWPSANKIVKIKKMLGCDIRVRECNTMPYGCVIEIIGEVKNDVGL